MSTLSQIKNLCKKNKKERSKERSQNCKRGAGGSSGGKNSCDKDCSDPSNRNDRKCVDKFCCYKKNKRHRDCTMPKGDVILKISCRSYPVKDVPPPLLDCSKGTPKWKVRTDKRKVDDTSAKLSKFKQRLQTTTLTQKDKERLMTTLSSPDLNKHPKGKNEPNNFTIPGTASRTQIADMVIKRIELLNDTVYKANGPSDKLNIHHLRPVWANGRDIPLNYFVAPIYHQKSRGAKTLSQLSKSAIRIDSPNVHDWWQYKIWSSANKVLHKTHKKFLNCAKPTPRITWGTYTENNITKMAKKLSLASPPIDIIIEMRCREFCPPHNK